MDGGALARGTHRFATAGGVTRARHGRVHGAARACARADRPRARGASRVGERRRRDALCRRAAASLARWRRRRAAPSEVPERRRPAAAGVCRVGPAGVWAGRRLRRARAQRRRALGATSASHGGAERSATEAQRNEGSATEAQRKTEGSATENTEELNGLIVARAQTESTSRSARSYLMNARSKIRAQASCTMPR